MGFSSYNIFRKRCYSGNSRKCLQFFNSNSFNRRSNFFFGLPQYLSGHPIVVIGVGSLWSIAHLFAPITESTYSLNLTAFFATIPVLLFHIRVWRSGKGWFAIVTHVGYNFLIQLERCSSYVSSCPQFFDNNFDFPRFHIVVGLAA